MRTFLAVLLSEETKSRLAQVTEELKRTGADVKWVEEDNFHITLFFLGDINPATCDAIISRMPEMTAGTSPFALKLKKIGAFPNLKRPRVIWAGVEEGGRELISVHRRVLHVMESLGFREDQKFSPHVTMGRVRPQRDQHKFDHRTDDKEMGNIDGVVSGGRRTGDNLGDSLNGLVKAVEKVQDIGEDCIQGISLMESVLTPKGAVYSELAFSKFTGRN